MVLRQTTERGKHSVEKTGLEMVKVKEGPRDHCPGQRAASVAATITFREFKVRVLVSSSALFSRRPLFSALLIIFWQPHSLRALLSAAYISKVNEDGEVRSLIRFP